jgi:hypothetical protein
MNAGIESAALHQDHSIDWDWKNHVLHVFLLSLLDTDSWLNVGPSTSNYTCSDSSSVSGVLVRIASCWELEILLRAL